MARVFQISELKKAIIDSGGIMSTIAERLGCDWHTAQKYINLNEEAKALLEQENESVIDLAESKLIENIQANDNTAILFYLKTKGKKRGYIERAEIDHSSSDGSMTPIVTTLTPVQLKEMLSK